MIANKLSEFERSYQEALDTIKHFTEDGCPEMTGLVKWMMTTDVNPYSYLPEGWADRTTYAEGFASLLHMIHHALIDDGEITFITVNDEPRIVFIDKYDVSRANVLTEQEKMDEKFHSYETDIKVLDINANDFWSLAEQYHIGWLSRIEYIQKALHD